MKLPKKWVGFFFKPAAKLKSNSVMKNVVLFVDPFVSTTKTEQKKKLAKVDHVCLWRDPSGATTQPILASLGAHSLSVVTLVVVSDVRRSTFGLL